MDEREFFFQPDELAVSIGSREDGMRCVLIEPMDDGDGVHMRIAIPADDAWRIAGAIITAADEILARGD